MLPVRTGATNLDFTSPDEEVGVLPVIIEENTITSIWEPDHDERFQLERGGRVSLCIESHQQPPVALTVVGPDCDDCGKPMTWNELMCMWICSEDDEEAGAPVVIPSDGSIAWRDGNTRSD